MHWTSGLCCVLALLAASPQQPQPPAAPAPVLPQTAPPRVEPRFAVVLDPAHGGPETGARLNSHLMEKDVTLSLAVRLRGLLAARGIAVTLTRDHDTAQTSQARAEVGNRNQAAACISLHATATGTGVHLFTSSLAPATPSHMLPWNSAQSAYITQSLKLSSEINSALAHTAIPVTLARTSIQPLDSMACPALAIELAPLAATGTTKAATLDDPSYQARTAEAIAAALLQWRSDWRQP